MEGAEHSVLHGATAVTKMNQKPTWVMEVWLNEYLQDWKNPDFQKTFELFWVHGYVVITADQNSKAITPEDVAR